MKRREFLTLAIAGTFAGASRAVMAQAVAEGRKEFRVGYQKTGVLVIAHIDDRYELLPRVAADKVRERDPDMIVLDHAQGTDAAASTSEDDDYYAQFKVPDDLMW